MGYFPISDTGWHKLTKVSFYLLLFLNVEKRQNDACVDLCQFVLLIGKCQYLYLYADTNSYKWFVYIFQLMDKIFNEKSWVEPLAVAGTSCNTDSENSSTEETRQQLGNKIIYSLFINTFVILI